jgi:Ca-activated chloride channel family protein
MAAAQDAAKQFAGELTPGINLGLIAYAGTPTVLVSPTTNHDATKRGIDTLQVADRTATGEGIFTALQAIATVGAVIGGGDTPPPARIVLFSDGKESPARCSWIGGWCRTRQIARHPQVLRVNVSRAGDG